jgi:integrase
MAETILDTGFLRLIVRYLQERRGIWFYYRRIPKALLSHYPGQGHRYESLQTRDLQTAIPKAKALAAQDDLLWASLRNPEGKDTGLTTRETRDSATALLKNLGLAPGEGAREAGTVVDVFDTYFAKQYGEAYLQSRFEDHHPVEPSDFYSGVEAEAVRLVMEEPINRRVLLSDALEAYLKGHENGQQAKFVTYNKRAISHLEAVTGDWPLDQYKYAHAKAVRDHLLAKGNKTGTVRRRLSVLKAIFNKARVELEIPNLTNPFERVSIAGEGSDRQTRGSFTKSELVTIATACRERDDDIRQLVALLMDTGGRLAEIVGLRVDHVFLEHEIPHVYIKPDRARGRSLKTRGSERKVPLVGMASWGAERAVATAGEGSGWLFPRYAADNSINSNAASIAIKKWLHTSLKLPREKTAHWLRHSMKDRLRHADVPEEVQNRIGGWGKFTVPQGYGEGHLLEQLKTHLEKVVLQ